jgi:hypothetical protein
VSKSWKRKERVITPAGVECRYYYEDYFRGRERQECRLIALNPASEPWQPKLCYNCPVPGILRANACPNLVLEGRVEKRMLGLARRVTVAAVCSRYLVDVAEPRIGCGHCHEERPGAAIFDLDEA